MTFSSPQIRDAYHRLNVTTQVLVASLWTLIAKHGYFIHIEKTEDSDVVIRISVKPHAGASPVVDNGDN